MALWLREDVVPAALKLGAPLRGLEDFDSYECRGRNRVRGATLSEHGRANALDVRGFKLANGKMIGLTDVNVAKEWRESLARKRLRRASTPCSARDRTATTKQHIHVDLAERRSGYKICQWDVREPVKEADMTEPHYGLQAVARIEEPVPLPRPRPRPVAHAPIDIRPRRKSACAAQVKHSRAGS